MHKLAQFHYKNTSRSTLKNPDIVLNGLCWQINIMYCVAAVFNYHLTYQKKINQFNMCP